MLQTPNPLAKTKKQLFVAAFLIAFVLPRTEFVMAQEDVLKGITDKEYAKMILNNDRPGGASGSIELAVKLNRPGVLVALAVDPSLRLSSEAVVALSHLPAHEAALAYADILKADSLWIRTVWGGRFGAIQNDFVATMKEKSSTVCGRDMAQADLFDADQRKQIINVLLTK